MKWITAAAGMLAPLAARPRRGGGPGPPGVEFNRHVAGLLGRLGCNAASRRDSSQGRVGLTLSLFGHDPARDSASLTRGDRGRGVNDLDPEHSLALPKSTGRASYDGRRQSTLNPGSFASSVTGPPSV